MSTVTDPGQYLPGMDVISSSLLEKVLDKAGRYDATVYTSAQAERVLGQEHLEPEDLAVLLSPAAGKKLEQMARAARQETTRFFGNSVAIFTPLYIANYCENYCRYCGFHCHNKIQRGKLSTEEMHQEMQNIAATGLQEILLLTGESRSLSGVEYIGEAVRIAKGYFTTIGIEIYPLNVPEYSYLQQCGADFVSVYQETYDPKLYETVHPKGPKRVFPYRFYAQERALLGGMRGVAFGSLLGLGDFRRDAFAAGLHAYYLQKKYPHAEISFSFPRLRPYKNHESNAYCGVSERELLQVILAYRLFMPFAGITISTRENARFRDNVVGMAATKISAGVKVGVGGHGGAAKGDEQFVISDPRSVAEIREMLNKRGLQPVFSDYVRMEDVAL